MVVFEDLKKELDTYLSPQNIELIKEAYFVASDAHKFQFRHSGEPFIIHPLSVAIILSKMKMDYKCIIAAILHDILEDTPITNKSLCSLFGEEVLELVVGVSKLTKINIISPDEQYAENLYKMIIAMTKDIRVILIKLADRLHNIRTLEYLGKEKLKKKAKETLEIYTPIANRLGMNEFKIEMEDLCFKNLFPWRYKVLTREIEKNKESNIKDIELTISNITDELKKKNFNDFDVLEINQGIHYLYNKMKIENENLLHLFNKFVIKIIVNNVDQCYRTLGILHSLYKPFINKFKDYISIPKENGYQALHSSLFGPNGSVIEAHICTRAMDRVGKNGIASDWLYKPGEYNVNTASFRISEWIKSLLEIQQTAGNSMEFIEHLKDDLFPDELYVFTPRGKIIKLPAKSTPVDFAYKVHTEVGNKCIGVKIDREFSPLNQILKSGQTIEIITSSEIYPNANWLNFVVTGRARSKIRHYMRNLTITDSVKLGKQLVLNAIDELNFNLVQKDVEKIINFVINDNNQKHFHIYKSVSNGTQLAHSVILKILNFNKNKNIDKDDLYIFKSPRKNIIIGNDNTSLIVFAKCCCPIPNDKILGIFQQGKGIIAHRSDCIKLSENQKNIENHIFLKWSKDINKQFESIINIVAKDKIGFLARLGMIVAMHNSNISNISVIKTDGALNIFRITISISNKDSVLKIINRVRKLENVSKVYR